jgi:hypothetical protein
MGNFIENFGRRTTSLRRKSKRRDARVEDGWIERTIHEKPEEFRRRSRKHTATEGVFAVLVRVGANE